MAVTPDTGQTEKSEKIFEGKSIAVIDDHPRVIQGYKMILSAYDASVIAFSSASELLVSIENLEAIPYDLIITDWVMPGMDGLDLIRYLRMSGCNIPIILSTTSSVENLGSLPSELKFSFALKDGDFRTILDATIQAFELVET